MKLPIAVLILVVIACKPNEQEEAESVSKVLMNAPSVSVDYVAKEEPGNAAEYTGDLIIKSANFRFQVDSVEKSTKNIEKLVTTHKAFIVGQNLSTAANEMANSITIRVPSFNFETLMEELSKESLFIDYRRISSQNVTEEYEDIQTRLKTKKEVRDRYLEILKTKAKTVEDILKAEEHIRVLQEEIESREGRLKFLQSRVNMSEISLEIYQKVVYKESPTLVEKPYTVKVTQALSGGWTIVTSTLLYIINCWPLLVAGSLTFWRWRMMRRKWRSAQSV